MKLLIVGLGSMGKRRARLTKGIDAAIQIVGVDTAESRRDEALRLGLADAAYATIGEAVAAEHPDAALVCTAPLAHAAVIGALTARHHSHPAVFLAALVGDLVLYLVGVPYMYLIMRLYLGSDATLAALVMKMAVFIPGDLIKLAIVTLAAPPLLRCLEKAGYTRS